MSWSDTANLGIAVTAPSCYWRGYGFYQSWIFTMALPVPPPYTTIIRIFRKKYILLSSPNSSSIITLPVLRRSLWQNNATQCLCIILLSRQLARSVSNNGDAMSGRWARCCCAWRCSWERGAWHAGWATRATAAGCCRRFRSAAGRAGCCGPPTCGPGAELTCVLSCCACAIWERHSGFASLAILLRQAPIDKPGGMHQPHRVSVDDPVIWTRSYS